MGSSTLYISTQASDPTGLAMNLEILHTGSGVPTFLEIGQPVAGATLRIGQPATKSGEEITYTFDDYGSTLTIGASGGVIRSLTWSWYLD
jgi:hypothetical protein